MRDLSRQDWDGDSVMKRIGHTAEQIIRKLKTAEQLIAQGKTAVEICRYAFSLSMTRTYRVYALCR